MWVCVCDACVCDVRQTMKQLSKWLGYVSAMSSANVGALTFAGTCPVAVLRA